MQAFRFPYIKPSPMTSIDFTPPPRRLLRRLAAPSRFYFSPVFQGLENLPADRPFLLVGNHTLYGVWDFPLLLAEIYERRGIWVHGLGDHVHFQLPIWRDLVSWLGSIDGTRENCERYMRAGRPLLVFPGGGREVCKRKGELYQLVWKNRTGFAELAIKHGYDLIPFAEVGIEDSFTIVRDADDLRRHPLTRRLLDLPAMRRLTRDGDIIFPMAHGLGGTPLPRPQRLYFSIGKPISTASMDAGNAEQTWALREQTATAIRQQIAALREQQVAAQDISPLRRWLMQG